MNASLQATNEGTETTQRPIVVGLRFIGRLRRARVPSITVPEEHADGLLQIMGLSIEDSHLVALALEKAASLNVRELTALVGAALPAITGKESREIVGTLLSLYAARTGMDMAVDSFVMELLAAARPLQTGESQSSETLQQALKDLLSVRPLSMISKARGIHTDHENTFCTVRILTDLRAVFDVDVKQEPVGFVMAHILKLGYHHAGKHTSLHIAMDKADIDKLIAALQRAQEKASTLSRTTSEKCGFTILAD